MFTGIIGAVGRVLPGRPGGLAIASVEVAREAVIGGSIAVNGVCLTVVELDASSFRADVVPETLSRTNLGLLQAGQPVNLELPLTLDRPLDGHLVQGHVDSVAQVVAIRPVELGAELTVQLPGPLSPYVAEKGSIAVDGTSLTVASVDDENGTFTLAMIPHTLQNTVAAAYRAGSMVNLEVDLVARYVARLAGRSAERGIK